MVVVIGLGDVIELFLHSFIHITLLLGQTGLETGSSSRHSAIAGVGTNQVVTFSWKDYS